MGKVHFPLINVRKDVTSRWHMQHFSGETAEEIVVPEFSNEYGFYTAFLNEVPDSGSSTKEITTTPPRISGLVEFRGTPIDPKTLRLKITPIQYFVNYQTGEILFHPAQAGKKFLVDYYGKGSLIEADDINVLHEKIGKLEKEHDIPEFLSFRILNQKKIFEVGHSFPSSTSPNKVSFFWETTFPDRVKENSIQISLLVGNREQIIGQDLPNTGSYDVDFQEIYTFSSPNSVKFKISAVGLNEDPLEKEVDLIWVDRIYWGISPHKNISSDQVNKLTDSELFPSTDENQKVSLKFREAVNHFKVIATPKRYPINKLIDRETSLSFIADDPMEILVTNQLGLEIPYLIYISTYPIANGVELMVTLGGQSGN